MTNDQCPMRVGCSKIKPRWQIPNGAPDARPMTASAHADVAQVSNLLYRRFPILRPPDPAIACGHSWRPQAGSTATQQVGNLRYAFLHTPAPDGHWSLVILP